MRERKVAVFLRQFNDIRPRVVEREWGRRGGRRVEERVSGRSIGELEKVAKVTGGLPCAGGEEEMIGTHMAGESVAVGGRGEEID